MNMYVQLGTSTLIGPLLVCRARFATGVAGVNTPALVFEPPPDPHIGLRSRIRHELLSPALVF